MTDLIDRIFFLWKKGHELESKFASYQGYKTNSIISWKQQTGLPWSIVIKLLSQFEIFSAPRIRDLIRQVVLDNENIFSREQCFITGFGNAGKSGDVILYEFSHTMIKQDKTIKTWEIHNLPPNSTIVFVEDIIGTGTQSIDYINDKLNQLLSSSHKPVLFSLCASPQGIKNINENTNFEIIYGKLLEKETHQFYSDECSFFTLKEKERIKAVNNKLKKVGNFDFDLGLLIAFYFTIPNNAMPIFWKDNYTYIDKNQKKNGKHFYQENIKLKSPYPF